MELFFQASLLIRILRQFQTKISYGHVTKIPRDDGLLYEPTTEVNGNDPYCKRVTNRVCRLAASSDRKVI